jgi:hypothetical protein
MSSSSSEANQIEDEDENEEEGASARREPRPGNAIRAGLMQCVAEESSELAVTPGRSVPKSVWSDILHFGRTRF